MRIGIPAEIKAKEGRVSLTPEDCQRLKLAGHDVFIQSNAGIASGYNDQLYIDAGVKILPDAQSVYSQSKLIVKVKEPIEDDLQYLTSDHLLFSFLHLAAEPDLVLRLQKIGLTAIAFETVETDDGQLPLLAPMSAIAGRIAGQVGTHLLHTPLGGKGILLGGLKNTEKGNVVVLGAGVAGSHAIDVVACLGANVTVIDLDEPKLMALANKYPNVTGLLSNHKTIHDVVSQADLVIGAVLVAGAKTPVLVSDDLVQKMESKSVIIDIAVDQGGCIETIKPTNYASPTYLTHDVLHFGVTNMPGAVPRTATQALSSNLWPYVLKIANEELNSYEPLKRGINLHKGEIILPALI